LEVPVHRTVQIDSVGRGDANIPVGCKKSAAVGIGGHPEKTRRNARYPSNSRRSPCGLAAGG
jgi:hypothetical protein